jgi:hypothetical protein
MSSELFDYDFAVFRIDHYNSCEANTLTTTFFRNNYHSTMPVQIFNSKEEALEWLKSFS